MEHDGGVHGALLTKDETRILSWSLAGTLWTSRPASRSDRP
jgi:hypothetical protein